MAERNRKRGRRAWLSIVAETIGTDEISWYHDGLGGCTLGPYSPRTWRCWPKRSGGDSWREHEVVEEQLEQEVVERKKKGKR